MLQCYTIYTSWSHCIDLVLSMTNVYSNGIHSLIIFPASYVFDTGEVVIMHFLPSGQLAWQPRWRHSKRGPLFLLSLLYHTEKRSRFKHTTYGINRFYRAGVFFCTYHTALRLFKAQLLMCLKRQCGKLSRNQLISTNTLHKVVINSPKATVFHVVRARC